MNYFPLLTAVVAFVFTLFLARQFVRRRKTHQIIWTVGMLFYALSALMEFLMNRELIGANVIVFEVYYVLAAPLVGLLGAGVVYLLARRRIANYFLGFVIVLSIGLAIAGFIAPIDNSVIVKSFSGELAEGFRAATHAYPMWVRIFSIILNSVGGVVLIGGALYSFIRDVSRDYNLFIVAGALLPMIGGSLMGLLGNPNVFFEFELGGTVFLFLGFILSDAYIRKREQASPVKTPTVQPNQPNSTYSRAQYSQPSYQQPAPVQPQAPTLYWSQPQPPILQQTAEYVAVICPICGTTVTYGANYCDYCGTRLR